MKSNKNDIVRNCDGNFGIMTALIMLPLLGTAGAAIDFTYLLNSKTELQGALDAAVLAAAKSRVTSSRLDENIARAYFQANSEAVKVDDLRIIDNGDGSLTGKASVSVKTVFMHIFGKDSVVINLQSTAIAYGEEKLAKATLRIIDAQGVYSKHIDFFTRDKNGIITNEYRVLEYKYIPPVRVGLRIKTPEQKIYNPPIGSSITINVGEYASYGYAMTVYVDPKQNGAFVNPVKYYSDAADASNWIRKTGNCSDPDGILNQWEDGGDRNFKDFQFIQTCKETTRQAADIRVVR